MAHRSDWHRLRAIVVCTDTLAILLAFTLVLLFSPQHPLAPPYPLHRMLHLGVATGVCILGWVALLMVYRLFESEYLLDGMQQYTRIAQASVAALVMVGLVAVADGTTVLPRSWLLAAWALSVIFLAAHRIVLRRVIWQLRASGHFRFRMLVIGAGEDGLAIAEQIAALPGSTELIGFLDEYSAVGTPVGIAEVLGEPLALARIARETGATDAIVVPQSVSWESLQALLQSDAESWGLDRLWLAPAFRDLLTTGMEVHQRGARPLLTISGPRIVGIESALKRGIDLLVALVTLPVVVPVCLGIALWLACVKHVQPFARQTVYGSGRRLFTLYTFPSLPELRRYHLWRLPALANVLRGDLSLVGPRPIDRALDAHYSPWHVMLASVRPGLTGPWWLLSGTRHLSVENEVKADLAYIRTYTIWADLRLLALTTRLLITRPRPEDRGSRENLDSYAGYATYASQAPIAASVVPSVAPVPSLPQGANGHERQPEPVPTYTQLDR